MKTNDHRLKELDEKLSLKKHVLEGLIPIWSQIDRRVHALKSDITAIEEERAKIAQGQLTFDGSLDF